jgi:enediyne biosynthesis protein E4
MGNTMSISKVIWNFIFCLPFLFLVNVNQYVYAQPQLVLDTIFLENQHIYKVTTGLDGDLWFLADSMNPKLYYLDCQNRLIDRTAEFSSIIAKGITDIAGIDKNQLLIGTATDYAWLYKDGEFTRIDEDNGLDVNESYINSVFYKPDKIKQFNNVLQDNSVYGIASQGYSYSSVMIDDVFEPIPGVLSTNERFLSNEDAFILSYTQPPDVHVVFYSSYGYYQTGSFNIDSGIEVQCANVNLYDYHWINNFQVGTNKGLYSGTGAWIDIFLDSLSIYRIVNYTLYDAIIGSDKGLFYQWSTYEPTYIDIGRSDFSAYDLINYKGCFYVATNKGLFKLKNKSCDDFKLKFDQNLQYLPIYSGDSLKLFPEFINGNDVYWWDFGDGLYADEMLPSHKYAGAGNYRIKLTASNGYCTDSAFSLITVYNDSLQIDVEFERLVTEPFTDETTPNGTVNIIDADGDFVQDIFLPFTGLFEHVVSSEFILNPVGFNVDAPNSAWGDLDNDGLNDLICGSSIFINRGNFLFQQKELIPNYSYIDYSHQCLLDYDNDGLLDIASADNNGFKLLHNIGNFKFEQVQDIFSSDDYVTTIKWFDIDNDNDNDLLIMRNGGETGYCCYPGTNEVYVNNEGTYELHHFDILSDLQGHYACSVADINNDGTQDIYFCDNDTNYLLLNTGNSFVRYDLTWLTNEYSPYIYPYAILAMNTAFADMDNNGFIDLVKYQGTENSRIFMNYGNLIFIDNPSNVLDTIDLINTRCVALSDLTGEGSIDMLIGNGDGYNTHIYSPNYLFFNRKENNSWVKFFCIGTKSNFNAIGTKIRIKATINGKPIWQTRVIETNSGKFAQSGYEMHFGLGDATVIDSLIVYWPSGIQTLRTNMQPGQLYKIVEPAIRFQGKLESCGNEELKFIMPAESSIHYSWYWNNELINDTASILEVDSAGDYYCIIKYPYATDTTDILHVVRFPVDQSTIWFDNGNSMFCPGDSLNILSTEYDNVDYHWLLNNHPVTGNNSSRLTIYQEATIQQVITNIFGCEDNSNKLQSEYFPVPSVEIPEEVTFCEGDSICLNLEATYSRISWSTGDTSSSICLNEPAIIQVTVWNEFNCSSSDSTTILMNSKPLIYLINDTIINYFSDVYLVTECSPLNSYLWEDGSILCNRYVTGNSLGIGNHIIKLRVIDRNNCTSVDSVYVNVIFNHEYENESLNILFFPNPSDGNLMAYIDNELLNEGVLIRIIDETGTVVKEYDLYEAVPGVYTIDLTDLTAGLFTVEVSNSKILERKRIVIIK